MGVTNKIAVGRDGGYRLIVKLKDGNDAEVLQPAADKYDIKSSIGSGGKVVGKLNSINADLIEVPKENLSQISSWLADAIDEWINFEDKLDSQKLA